MIESYAFRTRARTVDHLGREQIADCPTAISELWKNAYDAYARNVSLTIFSRKVSDESSQENSDDPIVACLFDDGHGMSRQEFLEKWLVIGTESKASGGAVPEADRKGLPVRVRQGQKGIGRLSAAALGPLLLFVSKRQTEKFVAALIDWRIFENPYLYLNDVVLPVVEFDNKEMLWDVLPTLFDELMSNIWGGGVNSANEKSDAIAERTIRIVDAWRQYDNQEKRENSLLTTREKIERVLIETLYKPQHIDQWSVWNGTADSGTALLVADIVFDLQAQLHSENSTAASQAESQAKSLLFQTLSGFIDPFVKNEDQNIGYRVNDFNYLVEVKSGLVNKHVISREKDFSLTELESLEHVLDGKFREDGVFLGRVKAFGKWVEEPFIVSPTAELGKRVDSRVGEFILRIGAYEAERKNTTMSEDFFSAVEEKSKSHAGLKVYRDGLRVLPYGREANDFFEIEKRRTTHAGREFWSIRRMFGRIGITRGKNPNLKDKAGREGLIDNKAAKVFRDLVENVLIKAARLHFGSDSAFRKDALAVVNAEYEKKKSEEGQKSLRARQRKEFKSKLNSFIPVANELIKSLSEVEHEMSLASDVAREDVLLAWQDKLQNLQNIRSELIFSTGAVPKNQGVLVDDYRSFRSNVMKADELIARMKSSLAVAIKKINPDSPKDLAYSRHQSHAAYLQSRLRKWGSSAKSLLAEEIQRLEKILDEKMREFHLLCKPYLDEFLIGNISLEDFFQVMEQQRLNIDMENNDLFTGYMDTLLLMRESVNLSGIAMVSISEKDEVSAELNRLHSLAQLGITVEIVSHEMDGLETSISEALRNMPQQCKSTRQYEIVEYGTRQIADRLRFLSPLKLSGDSRYETLTGRAIYEYVTGFLKNVISSGNVRVEASEAFLKFSVRELPSRVFPVFVNLINNSLYWTSGRAGALIVLDVVEQKIVISDNGPGVAIDDIPRLFTLFYTTKTRGGRGVGLYLSRSNLASSGHSIYYARDESERLMAGANFVIKFLGATYEQ